MLDFGQSAFNYPKRNHSLAIRVALLFLQVLLLFFVCRRFDLAGTAAGTASGETNQVLDLRIGDDGSSRSAPRPTRTLRMMRRQTFQER